MYTDVSSFNSSQTRAMKVLSQAPAFPESLRSHDIVHSLEETERLAPTLRSSSVRGYEPLMQRELLGNEALPDALDILRKTRTKISQSPDSIEAENDLSLWSGFFRKTVRERQDQLGLVFSHLKDSTPVLNSGGLNPTGADVMVENCIGLCSLPLGIAPNLVLNGAHFVVPMCVEEPSVIAAASSTTKLIAQNGGFKGVSTANIMTGQIQILDLGDENSLQAAKRLLESHMSDLIDIGNRFCPSMVKRGGGVKDLCVRLIPGKPWLVLHVQIDVCEAMGANIVNTVVEGMSPMVADLTGGRIGLKILTNLCANRRTKVAFSIPIKNMAWKGVSGRVVADRILEAYDFAASDPFRAATHNKGIMNGMDAVAIALGQDWRAIEAGAHAYAARSGQYGSLSHYFIDENSQCFVGSMEMPISVGTKGGALQSHSTYRFTHAMLGNPDAKTISQIIIAIGLAQNFAAIRALAIEGIQKGHMALHARNIAIAADVPSALVPEVAAYMRSRKSINSATAKEYLDAHSIFEEIHSNEQNAEASPQHPLYSRPSTFYIEFKLTGMDEPLSLNIAMPSLTKSPMHITLAEGKKPHPMQSQLLGENKGLEWLINVYNLLDRIKLKNTEEAPRSNFYVINKMKLISLLLNVISNQLMVTFPKETSQFLERLVPNGENCGNHSGACELNMFNETSRLSQNPVLVVGFPLLYALFKTFRYHVEQWISTTHPLLAKAMIAEQRYILNCISHKHDLYNSFNQADVRKTTNDLPTMMKIHSKRMQVTMNLLCECVGTLPKDLNSVRLSYVHRWGEFLELEATVAHDLSRWERDLHDGIPNVYVYWLRSHKLEHSLSSVEQFQNFVNSVSTSKREELFSQHKSISTEDGDSTFEKVFDMYGYLRTAYFIRQHYGMPPIDGNVDSAIALKSKL